ncbi:MAG: HAMP domain-containing histidine kinase, partial [Clostridia bacterium]|nr:HAMP domain-containing histidine kinase [Clostridia bacterium]
SICLLYRRTVKPFEKLKVFSGEVAKGNLDFPLTLDKYNSFGAFGEAFDIMRNNLKESRLAEQKSVVDKRRLMQEIGHDIKTPLASIKAIAECGYAVDGNENYAVILDKASAIDNLVNDFYHATLEEEGQLNVFLTRHSSKDLAQLIATCDYNNRASINTPPDCFTLYDKIRMTQIIDNIIANSYKYADTDISVVMSERDGKLITLIRDSGAGVPPEQLSYVMDRFYRGEKTAEKLGQGLGLHICRKLVERMGGEMICRNEDGFVVEIALPKIN